jgi:flagellar hook-associated protein 2
MSTSSIFSGNSRFATDFQSIIDRSVAIASLPLTQLNNNKTLLTNQSAAVNALDEKFIALQSAIEALGSTALDHGVAPFVSDESVVGARVFTGAMEGVYTVEVISLGAYTTGLSTDGLPAVSDPFQQNISDSASFTLTVDGVSIEVAPESQSLTALATAINRLPNAGVRATIVNVGSSSSPDYRLALQSTALAPVTIQLNDGTSDLITTMATGSNATYKVNGLDRVIQSESRSVTLAPGLEVTLKGVSPPGQPATITVARDSAGLAESISAFVQAYNDAVTELDKQRGKDAGALAAQSIVYSLAQSLRRIGNYSDGSSPLGTLAALGVTLDQTGLLSFDESALQESDLTSIQEFLGSSVGTGFLALASLVIDSIEDPVTGSLKLASQNLDKQLKTQDKLIQDNEDRIADLRQSLAAKMAAADALIASLEQQVLYMQGLFEAMKTATESLK